MCFADRKRSAGRFPGGGEKLPTGEDPGETSSKHPVGGVAPRTKSVRTETPETATALSRDGRYEAQELRLAEVLAEV